MVRTKETILTAVTPNQARGTVTTGVVKAFQRTITLADDHHRFVHKIVHDVISCLLKLLLAPRDMPDFRPQVLPLLLHEARVVIALSRD